MFFDIFKVFVLAYVIVHEAYMRRKKIVISWLKDHGLRFNIISKGLPQPLKMFAGLAKQRRPLVSGTVSDFSTFLDFHFHFMFLHFIYPTYCLLELHLISRLQGSVPLEKMVGWRAERISAEFSLPP